MATRMGIKAFRDNFPAIARDARAVVIVTHHNAVVGYYTPTDRDPSVGIDWARFEQRAAGARRNLEARGVRVAQELAALGIEDDVPFDDPWAQGSG